MAPTPLLFCTPLRAEGWATFSQPKPLAHEAPYGAQASFELGRAPPGRPEGGGGGGRAGGPDMACGMIWLVAGGMGFGAKCWQIIWDMPLDSPIFRSSPRVPRRAGCVGGTTPGLKTKPGGAPRRPTPPSGALHPADARHCPGRRPDGPGLGRLAAGPLVLSFHPAALSPPLSIAPPPGVHHTGPSCASSLDRTALAGPWPPNVLYPACVGHGHRSPVHPPCAVAGCEWVGVECERVGVEDPLRPKASRSTVCTRFVVAPIAIPPPQVVAFMTSP